MSGRKGLVWMLPLLFLSIPLLRAAFPGFHTHINTPWRADPLLAGGCVALLVRSKRCADAIRSHPRRIAMSGLLLLGAVPVMMLWPGSLGVFYQSWLSLGYSLLVAMAALGTHATLAFLLRNGILVWFGKYSYGIYMFHQTVNGILHGIIKRQAPIISGCGDAAITVLALAMTLLAAWLVYHLFEAPFIRFGHRFKYLQSSQADAGLIR
jgi:peptidoglycan/LPS O-acetylase OafA/YrhL